MFLGGMLSQGPGWRWVLFVNLPVCALILVGAYRLLPGGQRRARPASFDIPGAVLATAGMLLLVYALIRAPQQGWASTRTIGELATAAVVLAVFAITELRRRGPLFPFSIFRARGLAAADATQMIAFAGFVSVFFFLTLYMQNVLGYSPIRGGSAYLPVTADQAGLAAGLLNTSQQLGTALGLAIFSGIATARTSALLAAGAAPAAALTAGFHRALLACAIFLLTAAVIALRAANTRGEPTTHPDHLPAGHDRIPVPELTD